MRSFCFRLQFNAPSRSPNSTFIREQGSFLVGDDGLRRSILSDPEMINSIQHRFGFAVWNQFTLRPANAHTTHVCNNHTIFQEEEIELNTFIELAGNRQRSNRTIRPPLPFTAGTASIHYTLNLCQYVIRRTSSLQQVPHSLRWRVPQTGMNLAKSLRNNNLGGGPKSFQCSSKIPL